MSPKSSQRRRILASMAAAPLLAMGAHAVDSRERGITGRMAPELDAEFWLDGNGDDSHFSVTENRGKWVYLKCWQSWCPGCHYSGFPTMQKITEAFKDEPLFVAAGIQTTFEGHTINTADKVREMQLRYNLQVPMGHDPGQHKPGGHPNTMRDYRTGGTPWQVFIAPDGRVIFDGFHVDADKAIAYLRENIAAMKNA